MKTDSASQKKTDSCVHPKLKTDWQQYGSSAFSFEVVEALKQNELQDNADFKDDIEALLELLKTQADPEMLY